MQRSLFLYPIHPEGSSILQLLPGKDNLLRVDWEPFPLHDVGFKLSHVVLRSNHELENRLIWEVQVLGILVSLPVGVRHHELDKDDHPVAAPHPQPISAIDTQIFQPLTI